MKASLLLLVCSSASILAAAAEPTPTKTGAAQPETANAVATKTDSTKTAAAAKPTAKSAPTAPPGAGYLAKASAGPLRFAPVPTPKNLADLPPLPTSRDPQPTRPPEFPKVVEGPQTIVTTRPPEPVPAMFPPNATASKGGVEAAASVYLTPQALVRFFPHGAPAGMDAFVNVPFQVPIRPAPEGSSATYTIK